MSSKTNKLEPLPAQRHAKLTYAVKTKAGTNGKQAKTNQDIALVDVKLPFGVKLFGVCDGHGVNGHVVSAFIKSHLLSISSIKWRESLNIALKKLNEAPTIE